MEIEIQSLTKQGGRHYNEDVHGHWFDSDYVACLVADGAGGHGGGDVAAETVRHSMLRSFANAPVFDHERLRAYFLHANEEVLAKQAQSNGLKDMRTTLVLAAVNRATSQLTFAHCGDSRGYLFRDGKLIARTVDHSLVQQMVISGMIDDEGARLHPQRNLLLSALGGSVDELEITISALMTVAPGDVLLLCSDGVWEPLGDQLLESTLASSPSPNSWLRSIDDQVQLHAKDGHDNYTALTLWLYSEEQATHIFQHA